MVACDKSLSLLVVGICIIKHVASHESVAIIEPSPRGKMSESERRDNGNGNDHDHVASISTRPLSISPAYRCAARFAVVGMRVQRYEESESSRYLSTNQ